MSEVSEGGRKSRGRLKMELNCKERREEGREGMCLSKSSIIVNDVRVSGRFHELS